VGSNRGPSGRPSRPARLAGPSGRGRGQGGRGRAAGRSPGPGGGSAPDGVIPIAQIHEEYFSEPDKTIKKYDDKKITVSGYFVGELDFGNVYNLYVGADPNEMWTEQWPGECAMPAKPDDLAQGDEVVVTGTVSSVFDMGLFLAGCQLVSSTPGGGAAAPAGNAAEPDQPTAEPGRPTGEPSATDAYVPLNPDDPYPGLFLKWDGTLPVDGEKCTAVVDAEVFKKYLTDELYSHFVNSEGKHVDANARMVVVNPRTKAELIQFCVQIVELRDGLYTIEGVQGGASMGVPRVRFIDNDTSEWTDGPLFSVYYSGSEHRVLTLPEAEALYGHKMFIHP
jgi:hypothetical protein